MYVFVHNIVAQRIFIKEDFNTYRTSINYSKTSSPSFNALDLILNTTCLSSVIWSRVHTSPPSVFRTNNIRFI